MIFVLTLSSLPWMSKGVTESTGMSSLALLDVDILNGINVSWANTSHIAASAANVTGVSWNSKQDWMSFLYAIALNAVFVVMLVMLTCLLRYLYPMLFDNERAPLRQNESLYRLLTGICSTNIDDIVATAGLDIAMLIEFTNFSLKLLLFVGLPVIASVGAAHAYLNVSMGSEINIYIFDFPSRAEDTWLYYLHAGVVWYVVGAIQYCLYSAQAGFTSRRLRWLEMMPAPRARSLLVQNIPLQYQSDRALKDYFCRIFGRDVIERAYIVRAISVLHQHVAAYEAAQRKLEALDNQELQECCACTCCGWREQKQDDTRNKLRKVTEEQVKKTKEEVGRERAFVNKEMNSGFESRYQTSTGFLTFHTRRDAHMALMLKCTTDEDLFVLSVPPEPEAVIFGHLATGVESYVSITVAYIIIFALFVAFIPLTVFITSISEVSFWERYSVIKEFAEDYPGLVSLWDSFTSVLALTITMGLLPSAFMAVINNYMRNTSKLDNQQRLHTWYHLFLIVFVLFVTAIGSSIITTLEQLALHPASVLSLIATTLPYATHYYILYLIIAITAFATSMTRISVVMSYTALRTMYGPATAKTLCEPEDQAYHGIGSRSARSTIYLVLPIVFCTISPIMPLMAIFTFLAMRFSYTFLSVFAETRKPDLGGMFWCSQLEHVHQAVFFFILLMTGVLLDSTDDYYPALIAAASFFFLFVSYWRFCSRFALGRLPAEAIRDDKDLDSDKLLDKYIQPEMLEQEVEGEFHHSGLVVDRSTNAVAPDNESDARSVTHVSDGDSWLVVPDGETDAPSIPSVSGRRSSHEI